MYQGYSQQEKILENENDHSITTYDSDIESFIVFLSKKGNYISYYISAEIKN